MTANRDGGHLVGVEVADFSIHQSAPPEWRLLIVTGFLGGLTTLSTFSAEVVAQSMAGRMMWTLSGIAVHESGGIAMTLLGIGTTALRRQSRLAGG